MTYLQKLVTLVFSWLANPIAAVLSLLMITLGGALAFGSLFLAQFGDSGGILGKAILIGVALLVLGIPSPAVWLWQQITHPPIYIGTRSSSMITFHCNACGQKFIASREVPLSNFECPRCKHGQEIDATGIVR